MTRRGAAITSEFTGSWRTALRIARRSAWRNRGRSTLILMMLFLPAYAATILVVSWANLSGTSAQETTFKMGQADLFLDADPEGEAMASLPPGSRTVRQVSGSTAARIRDRWASVEYEGVDVSDPINHGRFVVREGHAPRGAGEVALTRPLAERMGAGIGAQIEAGMPRRQLAVVGIIDVSRSLGLAALIVPADTPLSAGAKRSLAVDLPNGGPDWSPPEPRTFGAMERSAVGPSPADRALEAAAVTLVGTFAGAQVALLAAAAFLVSVRRQRRELATVAATGGTGRQVGRIVLAAGLLLGAVAGSAGATLGLLTFALTGPIIERVADHPLIDVSIPVGSVAAVVAFSVATGLAAAYLPARTAGRRPVRADLGGQRVRSRADLALLLPGIGLIVAGTAALLSAAQPDGRIDLIVAGAVADLLGVVACGPALMRAVGRAAGGLPLAGRLALRHATRHRMRTAAAVAAVVAAVAGSVALTLVGAARSESEPTLLVARPGQVLLPPEAATLLGPDGLRRLAEVLPARTVVPLRVATSEDGSGLVALTPDATPVLGNPDATSVAPGVPVMAPSLDAGFLVAMEQTQVAVGGVETIHAVTGREATPEETAALRDGKAIAFNDVLVANGNVAVGGLPERRTSLAAVVATRGEHFSGLPGVLISDDTARGLGLKVAQGRVLVDTTRLPTADEAAMASSLLLEAQIRTGREDAPMTAEVASAKTAVTETNTMFYVLGAVSAVVTVVASVVAVGLTASELRGDLSTMAAVGATPVVRRRIISAQAGLIVGLGTPLGLLAGIGPAAGYVAYSVEVDWHTPWLALALIVVVPPVLATLLAGSLTRTRIQLVRRID